MYCLRFALPLQAMKDSVIIVSGGLDSITLLYDKAEEIALAISFDYGANHNAREIPFARLHCERLGIKHITIPLAFMHDYFKSSLLSGAGDIPEGHYADDNMRSTVVPIANHGGDHAIYPDCRPGFIRAISDATQAGTYVGVEVVAPYTQLTKTEIVKRGAQLGIDYAETWSCYKGGNVHCGKCGTCVERHEAFVLSGLPDPTIYE